MSSPDTSSTDTSSTETEAVGAELLLVPVRFAWPVAHRLFRRQRFSTHRTPLYDRSLRLDGFCVFLPHAFQVDRLSETLQKRSSFEQTYARPIRPKTDNELPSDILESVQHNQMPQFILRNIGRYEMAVDLEDPLPFKRVKGLSGRLGPELDEVRKAHVPKPVMAQIWSVAYVKRLRASLRRLLVEDPWEYRFGQEATSVYDGHRRNFIAEGTHPDEMPGANWGPDLIPIPSQWVDAPLGEDGMREQRNLNDEIRNYTT